MSGVDLSLLGDLGRRDLIDRTPSFVERLYQSLLHFLVKVRLIAFEPE